MSGYLDELRNLADLMKRGQLTQPRKVGARIAYLVGLLRGMQEDDSWPPVKKALWRVLMAENLNDGHYIKAFELVDKLHNAVTKAEASDEIDYDDARFNQGVEHVVTLLAKTLGATGWVHGDGSEDYDCDLEQTLLNILAAKGLYDKDEAEYATEANAKLKAAASQVLDCLTPGVVLTIGGNVIDHSELNDAKSKLGELLR